MRLCYVASMSNELQLKSPPSEVGFIDEKQFLSRVPISRRTLGDWKAKGIIPFVRINRRVLYDWESVKAALLRRQKGVSE
jgi:hypothetical protein